MTGDDVFENQRSTAASDFATPDTATSSIRSRPLGSNWLTELANKTASHTRLVNTGQSAKKKQRKQQDNIGSAEEEGIPMINMLPREGSISTSSENYSSYSPQGMRHNGARKGNTGIMKHSSSGSSSRDQQDGMGAQQAEDSSCSNDEQNDIPIRKRRMETDVEVDTPLPSQQLTDDAPVDRRQGILPPVDSSTYPSPDPPRRRKKRRQHREDDRIS